MNGPVGSRAPFVDLGELVAGIADGSCLGVGGALLTRLPLAALHRLAGRAPKELVYAAWGGGLPLEILLGAGGVAKVIFCFSSLDIFGLAPLFRAALESGSVEVEEWPALAFIARLEAAKQNLPSMPFRAPVGSDLLERLPGVVPVADRPGVSTTALAPRLDLDAFLLHAQRADEEGNVEIHGARGLDATAVFAAHRVLVTVEEVVAAGELGKLRGSFVIPRHFVDLLAVVPFGAYPTSCLPHYTADFARLAEITAASPPAICPPPAPREAARLDGAANLEVEAVRTALAALPVRAESVAAAAPSIDELMVCWLAGQFGDDSICSAGAVSPLAVTAYLLAKATHAPRLAIFMTSGGLLDIELRPMLLSLGEALDTSSARVHCGGEDSYRWYYQQGRVTAEVVTAAQIDRRGRTNNISVTSPSGRTIRLPGQGGMADVADLHRDFLLYLTRQSPLNLVERVERVSASRSLFEDAARRHAGLRPGRVKLITNLGVFAYEHERGELVLQSLHPGVTLEALRDQTGFEPAVAETVSETESPSSEMLRVLREQVDPLGIRRLEFVPAKERQALLGACVAAENRLVEAALHLGKDR